MDGGNTTVWLFVTTAVLQRSVTIEFRLKPQNRRLPNIVARELAPARLRSSRKAADMVCLAHRGACIGAASQPSGSKLPRHRYVTDTNISLDSSLL
ncbi:hypothetical protein F7R05_10365 [Pseudomonas koreensis]|nr:hypothetical protein F7R05_10365 [Pseudomonas koreensis]